MCRFDAEYNKKYALDKEHIFFVDRSAAITRAHFHSRKMEKNANAGGPKNCVKKNTKYNPQKKNGTAAQNH